MADQNAQQSPSSPQQSPSSQSENQPIPAGVSQSSALEMKGDDDAVVLQPENQPMISNTPPPPPPPPPQQQPEQPINEKEPKGKKTFPCRYCDKTFSTSTALGGHQNGHRRQRALDKKKVETPVSYQPYPTNYPRYPHYTAAAPKNNFSGRILNHNNPSMESSASSTNTWRLLAEFYANMRTKPHPAPASAPPQAATCTMFFGVRDFFGDSSAPTTAASNGASGSTTANVINLEDEEEEEEEEEEDAPELDLDLKL